MSSTAQSSVTQPGAAERYGNDYNAGDAMASQAGQLITRKLHRRLRPDRAHRSKHAERCRHSLQVVRSTAGCKWNTLQPSLLNYNATTVCLFLRRTVIGSSRRNQQPLSRVLIGNPRFVQTKISHEFEKYHFIYHF